MDEQQPSIIQQFFASDLYQNVISNIVPFLVIGLVIYAIINARKQPLWAEAYRRLRKNKLAIGALCVVGLYVGVAVIDSIGWKNDKNAERRTILDRIFDARFQKDGALKRERTYSAPAQKRSVNRTRAIWSSPVSIFSAQMVRARMSCT
jgi:hypothetical protein